VGYLTRYSRRRTDYSSRQFRYVKHFFWLSDEPVSRDALDSYVKSEKAEVAHDHAAWARETGKGLMFFSKRAEDKATPSGIIILVRGYINVQG